MSLAQSVAFPASRAPASLARAAGLILALIAVVLFAICLVSPSVLGDGDTWSHLATGDWIIAHRVVPRVDPFSLWAPAAPPWTAHEWLSEILLALAFRLAGWSGVVILTGLAAGVAVLVMGLRVARDLEGAALGLVTALGAGLWLPSLLARPHVLALPAMALWVVGLLRARDRGRAPPYGLAALMILWSNLHGGFIFGLALIVPFAAEAVFEARPGGRFPAARAWAAFAGAAAAAALVNPYGFEALLFPFRLMRVEHLSRISEWRPQDFGAMGPFEAALLALLGFALTRPVTMPVLRAALVAGLAAMALQHARHAQLLGLIAPMLLAEPIARAIGVPRPADWRSVARTALGASAAFALSMGLVRLAAPLRPADSPAAPGLALGAVPADLREKPVLNDYAFGGYLIWSHVRPFIDGRADMYGGDMLGLYLRLVSGNPATLEAALRRFDIAWTIFAPGAAIVATLDREPGWRRIYADAHAVVHMRDGAGQGPALRGD